MEKTITFIAEDKKREHKAKKLSDQEVGTSPSLEEIRKMAQKASSK